LSRLDGETKRKLREMNASELLEAIDTQDETLSISLSFEERVRLVVDDAYSTFMHSKVAGLIRRAGLRYPNADLRLHEGMLEWRLGGLPVGAGAAA